MFIAKNEDLIILANDSKETLEQQLQFMVYTSIEETDINYTLYNGSYLTPEEIAVKERERINNLQLTRSKFLTAIYNKNGTTPEQIEDMLSAVPDMLIYFNYSNTFKRGDALINVLCRQLNISSQEMDNIFLENN